MLPQKVIHRVERQFFRHMRRLRLQQIRSQSTVSSLQEKPELGTGFKETSAPKSARPFLEIPGPKSLPVIGTRWMHLPGGPLYGLSFYDKIRKLQFMYGDVIREEVVPGFSLVHLFKPEDYETIYRNEGKYPIRNAFFMLQRYNKKYNNGIHGLIDSQGEQWYKLRTQVQQKMLKPKAVSAYFEEQSRVAHDFITFLRHHRDSDNVIEDMIQHLYKFSLESIGTVCFNKRIGALDVNHDSDSEARLFIEAVNDVLHATHTELQGFFLYMYFDTPMFKRMVKAQNLIRNVSRRHAQDSLQRVLEATHGGESIDGEHGDLIPYLMCKTNLTEEEVMTVISEFFFGGVDTTSHMLGFILYNLCKNPEVMGRLREEIDSQISDPENPTHSQIQRLSYMRAVFRESLRILPVAPGNGRTTPRDVVLAGYLVPKDSYICLHHDLSGHEDRHFNDPDAFRPERWLRDDTDRQTAHPFVMMPFGFGARQCIGKRFAEQEVSLALVRILKNFDLEYCHDTDLKYEFNIINAPTTPLRLRITDRK